MKLITRTLTKTSPKMGRCDFFPANVGWKHGGRDYYNDYLYLIDEYMVDRSCSYHDGGDILYVVEVVQDEDLDTIQKVWNEVVAQYQPIWDSTGITYTVRIDDAADKK